MRFSAVTLLATATLAAAQSATDIPGLYSELSASYQAIATLLPSDVQSVVVSLEEYATSIYGSLTAEYNSDPTLSASIASLAGSLISSQLSEISSLSSEYIGSGSGATPTESAAGSSSTRESSATGSASSSASSASSASQNFAPAATGNIQMGLMGLAGVGLLGAAIVL